MVSSLILGVMVAGAINICLKQFFSNRALIALDILAILVVGVAHVAT